MLQSIAFLHVLYFMIGLTEAVCSLLILFEQGVFPFSLISETRKKLRKEI